MSQKSWWAYIEDVCEEGVVINADTLEEAERIASDMLRRMPWADFGFISYSTVERKGFFMYELGPLHFCNFTEEEEE